MWLLDVQKPPPALLLSTQIAAQQAAAASLESAAQLAAAAWQGGQHDLICTSVGALLNQSFDASSNGAIVSGSTQHQQVTALSIFPVLPPCPALDVVATMGISAIRTPC